MPGVDHFLDSINNMLMEEGMEGATCVQENGDVSYQTILCSFYDIIGKPPPPKANVVSSSCENLFNLHSPHQIVTKEHVMRYNGFNMFTHQMLDSGASTVTLPANGNVDLPNSANLCALSTQDVIKLNDGELMDAKISCWEEDKALDHLRSCSGRGSYAHFQLPSPYKEFSLNLAGLEFSFKDLKLHDHYVNLYIGEPEIPTGPPKHGSKEKGLALAGKGGKSGKKRTADAHEYVDLKGMIVNCAEAVAVGNARVANELLQQIWQVHGASADGNGLQRAAHYFSEALVARMRGTGGHQFRSIQHQKPSSVAILKSYKLVFEVSPHEPLMHYFANQSILKAAVQASRLHIVDYGLEYGIQWPCLINALADRKGGPPLLVITGIGFPQTPVERLEECGWRLAAYARTYNVPFQYHAIPSSKWEELDSTSFHFHKDEVLVVNCMKSLRHLADDSVDPRQNLLTSIYNLKPHLLVTADVSASYNSPYFVSRFREALNYYSSLFDMVDTLWGDRPERLVKEKVHFYSEILNIVACEGAERVVRAETYKQLELRIKRAGFEQLLIPTAILSRSRSHVKQHYHKDFFVHDDANKWMLIGWKGRTSMAMSAWKRSHAHYRGRVMHSEKNLHVNSAVSCSTVAST